MNKWIWLEALTFAKTAPNGVVRTGYALAAYADSSTGKDAYPSQATLAARLGISDRAVRKNLAWLKEAGWIAEERRGRRAGTQGLSSSYSLTIPTGTEVPTGDSPTGMDVPPGKFPTGTFESPNRNFLVSQPEPQVPPNQVLTKQEPIERPKRVTKTSAPEAMDITDAMRSWARDTQITVNLQAETAKFLSWHGARGNTFKDWNQAWRNWMIRAQNWAPPAPAVSPWDAWNNSPDPAYVPPSTPSGWGSAVTS